ncbi:histone-lysine N-methyltransferase SETMAR [Trichonephila clavipes]|nr:histone-lysine N-methyltransferase SETMAR [Trichonephila clavipes]
MGYNTPHSPDLAPSDYYLFRSLKILDGKTFTSIEVKNHLDKFLASKDQTFYERGIMLLPERWPGLEKISDFDQNLEREQKAVRGGDAPPFFGNFVSACVEVGTHRRKSACVEVSGLHGHHRCGRRTVKNGRCGMQPKAIFARKAQPN